MRERGEGQQREVQYLVLNRSCADLYEEVASVFAHREDIRVIVDRRGSEGMAEIPAQVEARAERRGRRRMASMVLELPEPREEGAMGAQ